MAAVRLSTFPPTERICDLIAEYAELDPIKDPDHREARDQIDRVFTEAFSKDTPDQAQVFWGLEKEWWRQCFDGCFRGLGPLVFDLGLHDGTIEPGFYESIKAATIYAGKFLMNPPTLAFYKELHRKACSHFKGRATSTEISVEYTGQFLWSPQKWCIASAKCLYGYTPEYMELFSKKFEKEAALHYLEQYYSLSEARWYCTKKLKKELLEKIGTTEEEFLQWVNLGCLSYKAIEDQIEERIKQINSEIEKRCVDWGLPRLAVLSKWEDKCVRIKFDCPKDQIGPAAEHLFIQFNERIKRASSIDDKVLCIADFYQMLEWLHGFADGQTRTDMVLMAKELCRNGSNPPILDQTYIASYSTKEEWVEYLKAGIKKWLEAFTDK